jgi:asparagine synthase (glutamine-hydrolysing)
MCGIAGIISANPRLVSAQRVQQMTDAIAHRGPDGSAHYINTTGHVALGHRRLSIIDLSAAAAQPMAWRNRYHIVHNGEIYNYVELRHTLQAKGYSFSTQSDTEVILAAYDYWKTTCLEKFDGMFAFAIWDEQEQTLFCARDRFGEKPFYYHHDKSNNQLLFGSEMKALWAAGVKKTVNNSALLNYITIGQVQHPAAASETFYSNIRSLAPAHYLLVQLPLAEVTPQRYWQLSYNEQPAEMSTDAYKEKFLDLFLGSIQRRLRSDVPVGTSLSGGLDSSSIVAAINKYSGGNSMQKCFSAVFPGFEKDESSYIKMVTNKFGLNGYTVTPDAAGLVNDFETLCRHQEAPFESSSIYAQYKVYELAKQQGVKVILDGQGADETLAGYPKYAHWYLQELLAAKQYGQLKHEARALRSNKIPFSWGWKNYLAAWLPSLTAKQLEKREYHKQAANTNINKDFLVLYRDRHSLHKPVVKTLNDILHFNSTGLGLETLLRYADRNAMAHGREVRLPFLNHQLVEFIFSVPASLKIHNGFTKYLLRLCMNEWLPEAIVWRTDKTGFEPPQAQWMTNTLLQERAQAAKQQLVSAGILNQSALHKKNQPLNAHAADNFEWRYLVAANFL